MMVGIFHTSRICHFYMAGKIVVCNMEMIVTGLDLGEKRTHCRKKQFDTEFVPSFAFYV